ncbi:MAG: peptidyl-prolyl cis-trans isomerase [Candidatus Omnitrophota bacterium]
MRQARPVFITLLLVLCFVCLPACDQLKNAFQPTLGPKNTAASAAKPQPMGTVLAKVNSEVITLESFDEKIKNLADLSPDLRIDNFEDKKTFLNDLVTQELIFQEAKSRGIDKQKDVKNAVEEFGKSVMARQLVLDETKGLRVERAEIDAFYNTYRKDFAAPEEIKIREIVVASEPTAKDILISILQGGDFASIAREKSIAPTAAQGGDAGVIAKTDKFDRYREVITTMEIGQVSQIFKGPDGRHYIVKVEEKRGGGIPALMDKLPGSDATLYDQIQSLLLQQKQAERIKTLTDKLRHDAKIETKEELLR